MIIDYFMHTSDIIFEKIESFRNILMYWKIVHCECSQFTFPNENSTLYPVHYVYMSSEKIVYMYFIFYAHENAKIFYSQTSIVYFILFFVLKSFS